MPENGVFSCVPFCLRSLMRFARFVRVFSMCIYNVRFLFPSRYVSSTGYVVSKKRGKAMPAQSFNANVIGT